MCICLICLLSFFASSKKMEELMLFNIPLRVLTVMVHDQSTCTCHRNSSIVAFCWKSITRPGCALDRGSGGVRLLSYCRGILVCWLVTFAWHTECLLFKSARWVPSIILKVPWYLASVLLLLYQFVFIPSDWQWKFYCGAANCVKKDWVKVLFFFFLRGVWLRAWSASAQRISGP